MYHGSENKFSVFSYKYLGKNGTDKGIGIYFSNKGRASGYAKPYLYKVELDLDKEASQDELTFESDLISELISHEDYLSNYGDVTYEGYAEVYLTAYNSTVSYVESDVHLISVLYNSGLELSFILDTLEDWGYTHSKDEGDYIVFNPDRIKILGVDQ